MCVGGVNDGDKRKYRTRAVADPKKLGKKAKKEMIV